MTCKYPAPSVNVECHNHTFNFPENQEQVCMPYPLLNNSSSRGKYFDNVCEEFVEQALRDGRSQHKGNGEPLNSREERPETNKLQTN